MEFCRYSLSSLSLTPIMTLSFLIFFTTIFGRCARSVGVQKMVGGSNLSLSPCDRAFGSGGSAIKT